MIRFGKIHRIAIGILLLFLSGYLSTHVFAQDDGGKKFFPETGHWITGAFLTKYNSVPNPDELFGNPITDAFTDGQSGILVQYFEKVRFEYHPYNIPDLKVTISNLGSYIYQGGQTLPVSFNPSVCQFYPEVNDGYYVCYDFLDFYLQNGGVAQFGYPISNFEIHDGWIVQYFQRACLEWHPEFPSGQWVTVANLGSKYFHSKVGDPRRLQPNRSDAIPFANPNEINVRAFVATPVMPFAGSQTVNTIVRDQNRNPVPGVELALLIKYPGGRIETFEMPATNRKGISSYKFRFDEATPGIVEILITASWGTLGDQTKTSFQVWW